MNIRTVYVLVLLLNKNPKYNKHRYNQINAIIKITYTFI